MSYFRINIYLQIKHFISSIFLVEPEVSSKITKIINKFTNKKYTVLTSQLRVGFYLLLKYLKQEFPQKNEIIISSYNLAEMINIPRNLKLKIVFAKSNENIFMFEKDLKKKINKKTLAVVTTNIFNSYEDISKIKKICLKKEIPLIEDNALYFGNFHKKKNKKIYAGSIGDYSLNSFNIMKNISAMYGGSVSSNNNKFIVYAKKEISEYKQFSLIKYAKQCFIFILLKLLSLKFFYRILFFDLIKYAHSVNNKFILKFVYPSLNFRKKNISNDYHTKISSLSLKMILLQLKDIGNIMQNHKTRKDNNIYFNKKFKQKRIEGLKLVSLKDPDFQNFNDFPIIVNDKKLLLNFLFKKGIETKAIQYLDCSKIFLSKNNKKEILDNFEDKILCLPNHKKISKKYIDYIINCISSFQK